MGSSRQAGIQEWLDFNELSRADVSQLLKLRSAALSGATSSSAGSSLRIDADETAAWCMAADALADFLPQASGIVHKIRDEAPRCLSPRDDKPALPFVREQGSGKLPYISCHYQRRPSDLLNIAHEFAHAVQIVASQGSLMPPVAREVCAFLGELALIAWLERSGTKLHAALELARREEDVSYLGADADALSAALDDHSAAYHYRWNYPIARVIAPWMFRNVEQEGLEALFHSGERAPELLPVQEILDGMTVRNSLPPFSETKSSTVNVYRQLGAIALLDIAGDGEKSRVAIGERYSDLLRHLQSGSVFVGLDNRRKPIGYTTWRCTEEDGATPQLLTHHAPFGDDDLLIQVFRQNVPAVANALPARPTGESVETVQ